MNIGRKEIERLRECERELAEVMQHKSLLLRQNKELLDKLTAIKASAKIVVANRAKPLLICRDPHVSVRYADLDNLAKLCRTSHEQQTQS